MWSVQLFVFNLALLGLGLARLIFLWEWQS